MSRWPRSICKFGHPKRCGLGNHSVNKAHCFLPP
ncbi:Uncharacterised protein [Vibrio cholerae]|nr:Uncharacterised protein [Vibrio cholerae]